MIDNAAVIFRPTGPQGRLEQVVFTERPAEVAAFVDYWASTPREAADELGGSPDVPDEPLVLSAQLMSIVADALCSGDQVDPDGCGWYHSVWQYLRLLDMVSTPSWHSEFFHRELVSALRASEASHRVIISGAADYSMLAHVLLAAAATPVEPDVTVVDLCPTPLFACSWYAKRSGSRVRTISTDIREIAAHPAERGASLICCDAFLSRFSHSERHDVLRSWRSLLAPGGFVVTTVRVHDAIADGPRDKLVQRFGREAASRLRRWSAYVDFDAYSLVHMAEVYAERIGSNPVRSEAELVDECKRAGLKAIKVEHAATRGEFGPAVYLRLVLRNG
ncbi:MAG: hypothetical protein ACHQ50_12995 [Fimbriimonadales bacterium]